MLSFYSEDKKRILLHLFVFSLVTFYIISTAANILLFHFVLDINLAKLGMLSTILGLGVLVWRDLRSLWNIKFVILVISGWTIYLLINSKFSLTPVVSFKLVLRVLGAWIIALEMGLLLYQPNKNNKYPVVAALFVGLLLITTIWILELNRPSQLIWFQQHMPNYTPGEVRIKGLYLNPNELGYALVMQTMLLIWFCLHHSILLIVIPLTLILSFIGIIQTQSRNSFLGLIFIVIAAFVGYLGHVARAIGVKKTMASVLGVVIFIFIFMQIIPGFLPDRINNSVNEFENIIETLNREGFAKAIDTIPQIKMRKKIWNNAFERWKHRPWLGLGLGSYLHVQRLGKSFTTHNFVFGVLVEQGTIGIVILLIFTSSLLLLIRNWLISFMILAFPLTLLFDDLSPSYVFPVYVSLFLGLIFNTILQRHKSEVN